MRIKLSIRNRLSINKVVQLCIYRDLRTAVKSSVKLSLVMDVHATLAEFTNDPLVTSGGYFIREKLKQYAF
jgi:hypothetical protein